MAHFRRILKNKKGHTLSELMITVAIGTIVSLAASTLMVFIIEQFQIAIRKNEAEENLVWASYYLRYFMSQAISLSVSTTGANPPYASVRNAYNLSAMGAGAMDGTVDAIAFFDREWSTGLAPTEVNSILMTTAIYLQRPDSTANPQFSGRLFINPGYVVGGAGSLAPSTQFIFLPRIVDFRMTTTAVGTNAKSTQIIVTTRYFKSLSGGGTEVWCPAAQMGAGACVTTAAWRDVSATVEIGFRNNILLPTTLTGSSIPERLYGGIYFWRSLSPNLSSF